MRYIIVNPKTFIDMFRLYFSDRYLLIFAQNSRRLFSFN